MISTILIFIATVLTGAITYVVGVRLNSLITSTTEHIKGIPNKKEKVSVFMDWNFKYIVKLPQIYLIPILFMISVFADPKYNLFEKQISSIGFCVFGICIGLFYQWMERNEND